MSKLIPALVAETGLSEFDILRIARDAPSRYRTYRVEKRSGGYRLISQPAIEVKILQKILSDAFLASLPVHAAAMAYRKGRSIRHNAAVHAANGPILKFDFKDFFPSIKSDDWIDYCKKTGVLVDPIDISISTNLLFSRSSRNRRLVLAIGAPSSPFLSNILMHDFDDVITRAVEKDKVTYSRYADDLTFSAKRTGYLTGVEKTLRRVMKEIQYPLLSLNEEKTVLATKKYKRFVTGLVLTNDGQVSIGQKRKRLIRAMMHRHACKMLNLQQQAKLSGYLAFINSAEPAFLVRLQKKYGSDVVRHLRSIRIKRFGHVHAEYPQLGDD